MKFSLGFGLLTAGILLSVSVGTAPVQAAAFAVPCTDPRGCPDLTPNTMRHRAFYIVDRTVLQTDCAAQEGLIPAGDQRILRFSVEAANIGSGDLRVGNPAERPDLFAFSPCHQHYHFQGFADYRLWSPDQYAVWRQAREANPDAKASELMASIGGTPPVVQGKQAFCMEDSLRYRPDAPPGTSGTAHPAYTCANQGISAGWSDLYGNTLDGQWIVITGVPAGDYVLEVELNAERALEESTFGNNAAHWAFTVPPHPPGLER